MMLPEHDFNIGDEVKLMELTVPTSKNERQRIKVLKQTKILSTPVDVLGLDHYTSLMSRAFKTPIALTTFIDVNQQWVKSSVGSLCRPSHRDHAFCSHLILDNAPPMLIIADSTKDPRFESNPFVTGQDNIRFYAGAVIMCQGMKLGTLCVMDKQPRSNFGEREQCMLLDLAAVVSSLVEERLVKMNQQELQPAKLIIGTNYHLKKPIEALQRQTSRFKLTVDNGLRIRENALRVNLSDDTTATADLVSKDKIADLRLKTQRLTDKVELVVKIALLYNDAQDRILSLDHIDQHNNQRSFRFGEIFNNLQRMSKNSETYNVIWQIPSQLTALILRMDKAVPKTLIRCLMELGAFSSTRLKVSCGMESLDKGGFDKESMGNSVLQGGYRAGKMNIHVAFAADDIQSVLKAKNAASSHAVTVFPLDEETMILHCIEMIGQTVVRSVGGEYKQQVIDADKRFTTLLGSPVVSVMITLPCLFKIRALNTTTRTLTEDDDNSYKLNGDDDECSCVSFASFKSQQSCGSAWRGWSEKDGNDNTGCLYNGLQSQKSNLSDNFGLKSEKPLIAKDYHENRSVEQTSILRTVFLRNFKETPKTSFVSRFVGWFRLPSLFSSNKVQPHPCAT